MDKTLTELEGFRNRHLDPLPSKICLIKIIKRDIERTGSEQNFYYCEWFPYNPENYLKNKQPAEGYLGTAKIVTQHLNGIGFHAWEQNDSEFVYYQIIE